MADPSGRKVGVYVCHCGGNISDYVDVERVASEALGEEAVVVARSPMFACSEAGQQEIAEDIATYGLDGLVVASCSPLLHEHTFRKAAAAGGLNPFFFHMVNIREHNSWVHTDRTEATRKAMSLARAAVARVPHHKPMDVKKVPINPNVLIVGGGVAGLGLGNGRQKLGFVPEHHTDFIWSTFSEQWGLLGSSVVVALFVGYMFSVLALAFRTREPFGRLVLIGLITMQTVQAAINIGMNIGIAPITACSDLLQPGGYGRVAAYWKDLAVRMDAVGATTIDEFVVRAYGVGGPVDPSAARLRNTELYVARLAEDARYHALLRACFDRIAAEAV